MGGSSEEVAMAFEFDEEQELMETTSEKLMAKFQPKNHDQPLDKYTFLQHFTSDSDMKQTTMDSVMCIDIHEGDDTAQPYASGLTEENTAYSVQRTQLSGIVGIPACYNEHGHIYSVGMGVSTDSDGEEENGNSQLEPSSSPCSDIPEKDEYMEDMEDSLSDDFHSADIEMDEEGEVSLRPDFITCGTTLYVEPLVMFSPVGIKLTTRDSDYDEEISVEWEISDIVYINCKWAGSAEGVAMKILIQADHNDNSEKEGFIKVSFLVSDIYWQEKQHKIKNLASRYEEIWNSTPMIDTNNGGNDMDSTLFFSKYYFSKIPQNFEDVIYPKGDPDAVSISKRDVDLLLPETFVNDTIIDFYIKYLSNKITDNRKQRLHFFNSFFFRKLADLDKDPGKAAEGRAAFLRVRKWTRKFNIFDKDFIFIPVNFNLHWSLLVICHPGETLKLRDDVLESQKVPCILHMDSLKGSHSGLKNIIQSYLWEEWKERHPESTEDDSSKFLNLRFVSLELPQQENCYDCGLFLLHYVERFLDDAPSELDPFVITKYSSFLTPEWFPPSEASLKRSVIRVLIYNLLNETCEKDGIVANAASNGHSQNSDTKLENETGVELLSQSCCPTETISSPVIITRNGNDDLDKLGEGENMQKNICDGVSQYQDYTLTQTIEPETCILVDEEEEEEKPSTIPNEEEQPGQNHDCGTSPNDVSLKSPVVCTSETRHSVLDTNGFPEDSIKKDEIMGDPASPFPNPSGYVPETPVVSLFDITDQDDGEKAEKPIAEQIMDTPKTPIMSSVEVREPNQLQNENHEYGFMEHTKDTPKTPIKSSVGVREPNQLQNENCEYGFSEDSSKKDEIMEDRASPLPNPSEYVPETLVVSLIDQDDGEKTKKPIAEQIMDTPNTRIISSVEVREPNGLQNENCEYGFLEDSIKKGEIKEDPASPLPNPSEYVPETPVASLLEITNKDNVEKAKNSVAEKIMDTTKALIMSSAEVRDPNELQNENCEYVPETSSISSAPGVLPSTSCEKVEKSVLSETPSISSAREVLPNANSETVEKSVLSETPSVSSAPEVLPNANCAKVEKCVLSETTSVSSAPEVLPNANCEKVEKCVLSETPSISSAQEVLPNANCEKVERCVQSGTDHCGYVPESPILPPDQLHSKNTVCNDTEQVDMQIDETPKGVHNGEKESSIIIAVDPGTIDGDSARVSSAKVSSGEVVFSDRDDEGSVDKDQVKDEMPRKKRRRVAVVPEGPRRVTRSSLRGSNI